MARPALSTFAGVNPACHQLRHAGQGHLGLRQVYGHDPIRLWRCRTGGEAFAARRGSARCTTQLPEATAAEVSKHLGAGCSVRATARLVTRRSRDGGAPVAGLRPSGRALSRAARAPSEAHGLGV
jgi:hypothetical protein